MRTAVGTRMVWLAAQHSWSASQLTADDNSVQSSWLRKKSYMPSYVACSGRMKASGVMPCSHPIMMMYFFAFLFKMPFIFYVLVALTASAAPLMLATSFNSTRPFSNISAHAKEPKMPVLPAET